MKDSMIGAAATFEAAMGKRASHIETLSGGFTNVSYLVVADGGKYILRIPGKGTNEYINRRDEIENMKRLAPTGLLPEMFYSDCESGVIVSRYVENNAPFVAADIDDAGKLGKLMSALAALHGSGIQLNSEFDIVAIKDSYVALLKEMGAPLPEEVSGATGRLDRAVDYLFKKYPKRLVPCHGDPKLNNFLFSGDRLFVIDWEYSGMVDKYFDLVNLAMTNYLSEAQEQTCLRAYEACDDEPIIEEKYILYKVITDYLWLYWHLIKLHQGEMVDYNSRSWRSRLERALRHLDLLGADA